MKSEELLVLEKGGREGGPKPQALRAHVQRPGFQNVAPF